MRKAGKRALAVLAGLGLALVAAPPANAHVADAYFGDRGHAWTNTVHTRVGVEDQRRDSLVICVTILLANSNGTNVGVDQVCDENNNDPGYTAKQMPAGLTAVTIRVCSFFYPSMEFNRCGNDVNT